MIALPRWPATAFASLASPVGFLIMALAVYLPPHLASRPGLSLSIVGAAWATVRLLDLGVDPLVGFLVDRTSTRLGRYKPWIIGAAPILVLGVLALFATPSRIGPVYVVGSLLILYLGLSIFMIVQSAWAAALAPGYNQRSRLFGLVQLLYVAGGVAALVVPTSAATLGRTPQQAIATMGWVVGLMIPIAALLACLWTPEPTTATDRKGARLRDYVDLLAKPDLLRMFVTQLTLTLGPGWMGALYLFYFTSARGFSIPQASLLLMAYFLAGLVGAPLTSWAAVRFSKHRTLQVVTCGYAACLMTTVMLPKGSLAAHAPVLALCGMGNAGFDLLIRSMLADVADEVRLEQGRDQTSLVFALNSLANKIAQALAIGLSYPLLARIGFLPALGAGNSPGAVAGLQLVFLAGPIFFVLLGAASVVGWRLTPARHAEVRRRLETPDFSHSAATTDADHRETTSVDPIAPAT